MHHSGSGVVCGEHYPVLVSDEEPTTEELRLRQRQHEREERQRAVEAPTGAESDSHQRRAEKAGYLRRKLEEREQAERRAGLTDG